MANLGDEYIGALAAAGDKAWVPLLPDSSKWPMNPLMHVSSNCFLELFSGESVLTLAARFLRVPAVQPWDKQRNAGMDVLDKTNGELLKHLVQEGYISACHMGTPCVSMGWARIPQVRSLEELYGLRNLGWKQVELVKSGNDLMRFSVDFATFLDQFHAYWSIENPFPSWIWVFPEMRKLWRRPSTCMVLVTQQSWDAPWYKLSGVMGNFPGIECLDIGESNIPSRIKLKGFFNWQGVEMARTAVAAEYPIMFCLAYMNLLKQALSLKQEAESKLLPVPKASKCHDCGVMAHCLEWERCPGALLVGGDDTTWSPFSQGGAGALKDFTPDEHGRWAEWQRHEFDIDTKVTLEEDLVEAVQWELDHTAEYIEEHRARQANSLLWLMWQLEPHRQAELNKMPGSLKEAVKHINKPVIDCLENMAKVHKDDRNLGTRAWAGFPFVGVMPALQAATVEDPKPRPAISVQELQELMSTSNELVVAKLKESEFAEQVFKQTYEDFEKGWMTEPREINDKDMRCSCMARRIPVEEYREHAGGYRYRMVDHHSENLINAATLTQRKLIHDTLDHLWKVLVMYMEADQYCCLSKGDVASVYRMLPILPEHVRYEAIVFMYRGKKMISFHKRLSFGGVSSVWGWHWWAATAATVARRVFKVPTLKYVDDYFNVAKPIPNWSMTDVVSLVLGAMGTPLDPRKTERHLQMMVVLGMRVSLNLQLKEASFSVA